jgi:hypothetical protein
MKSNKNIIIFLKSFFTLPSYFNIFWTVNDISFIVSDYHINNPAIYKYIIYWGVIFSTVIMKKKKNI